MKNYSQTESVINCNQSLSDKVHNLTYIGMFCIISIQLGVPVCTALLAFGEEKYDDVSEK